MRPTYHLIPAGTWAGLAHGAPYETPSLAEEGFVHCTDGADALVATANRHYRGDPRAYLALTIDLDAAGSPWRIEDPAGLYPHVYGPIAPGAIVAVTEMRRAPDGRFTTLADGG